jgi:hypothetical protein
MVRTRFTTVSVAGTSSSMVPTAPMVVTKYGMLVSESAERPASGASMSQVRNVRMARPLEAMGSPTARGTT